MKKNILIDYYEFEEALKNKNVEEIKQILKNKKNNYYIFKLNLKWFLTSSILFSVFCLILYYLILKYVFLNKIFFNF